MPLIETKDGMKVNYIKKGNGKENVLFIHGNLASSEWWRMTFDGMPEKYTAYAIDLPGSGETPETGELHTMEYLVSVVESFVDEIGLDKFYLVGHSMGGGISQLYAMRNPEKVVKMLLLDAMAADGFHTMYKRGLDIVEEFMRDKKKLEKAMRVIMPECKNEDFVKKSIDIAFNSSGQVFLEHPVTMHEANWFDKLGKIKCPVLFLHGEKDTFVPKDGSERTAAAIPDCEFKYLKNCGHCPNIEVPEVFKKELFTFLEK